MLVLVKPFVLAYNTSMKPEEKVAKLLISKRKTLCLAESCSGGLLSNRITNVPGSSKIPPGFDSFLQQPGKNKNLKSPAKVYQRLRRSQ